MFIAALFTIAKTWNQPKCLLMIWSGIMWHMYTMEYYAAMKINEFVFFVGTWMILKNILSKLTRTENEIRHILTHRSYSPPDDQIIITPEGGSQTPLH
uniref:Uncharacterized protein n=1 Tax=Callithrix jacchus TaxID=9483 RepID=A0A8I3WID4_CALJA